MRASSAVAVQLLRAGVAPPSLIIAIVLLAISIPYFATLSNTATILGAVGPLAVAAVGEMLVIVTGGFDISGRGSCRSRFSDGCPRD